MQNLSDLTKSNTQVFQKSLQNMARVSLHKYLSLDETLSIFAGLGLFKILQKKKDLQFLICQA